jgi:hypothetical protein
MNIFLKGVNYITDISIRPFYINKSPIVIAGLGRCGTTLLTRSLVHTLKGKNYFIDELKGSEFRSGTVFKTHDYPVFGDVKVYPKVIFMFGNPLDTIVSTIRVINEWGHKHYSHLHSKKFVPNESLIYEDGLNLERLFDEWYKPQKFSFLSIRYESIYEKESQKLLSRYLDYKIKMLPYKERKSNWSNHPQKEILLKTYGSLLEKINNAENCKLWDAVKEGDNVK